MVPKARRDNLLVQEFDDEVVVYDQERHCAHRLNRTAALVWRHSDGQRTIADLALILQQELDLVADENLVWLTLDRLDQAHLLQESLQRSPEQTRLSRRQVVRKASLVGVLSLLLPVITTLVTPSPATAQSSGLLPDPGTGGPIAIFAARRPESPSGREDARD
jgi:hypothetical protein